MSDWGQYYEDAGHANNVDPALLRTIVQVESGGDPAAVSTAGAKGPAQLLPQTAANLGVADPTDPQQAIGGAAKLLAQNLDRYKNVDDAVRAYHGGTDQANWGPKTQAYHDKVMATYASPQAAPKQSDDDLLKEISGGGTSAAPVAAAAPVQSDADLLKEIGGSTVTAPVTTPQGAAAKPGDTSGFTGLQKFGTGIVQGASDVGHTTLNAEVGLEKYLFGQPLPQTNALYSALGIMPEQNTAEAQKYKAQFGSSLPATGGRIVGQTALTAPVISTAGVAALPALGAISPLAASTIGLAGNTLRAVPYAGPLVANALTGATQGGTAALMTSGANPDVPLGQQVKQGMEIGGVLGTAAPIVAGAAKAGYNALTGVGHVSPLAADLANTAVNDYYIPLRGSQITGAPAIRFLDSVLSRTPFSGMGGSNENIGSAFTRAASNTIGADSEVLTPEVVRDAKQAIGQKFDQVAVNTMIKADSQFLNDLSQVETDSKQVLTEGETHPIQAQINNVLSKVSPNGEITGDVYQALTRKGTPLDKAMDSDNPNIAHYAQQVKGALDDALQRSAPPEMQDLLSQAKYQWKNYVTLKPLIEKAQDGQLSPALLLGQVRKIWNNYDTGGGGDLGALARIGQRFLKEPPSSGTSERLGAMALLGEAGTALANPQMGLHALAGTVGTVAAARGASAALRSDWYRNLLLNQAQTPGNAALTNLLIQNAGIPASVSAANSAPMFAPGLPNP